MNTRRAVLEQFGALLGGVFDAKLGRRGAVIAKFVELFLEGRWNFCSAQGGKPLDLRRAAYRNDSRDERHFYAVLRQVFSKLEIIGVIEKQLCEHKVRAGGNLC